MEITAVVTTRDTLYEVGTGTATYGAEITSITYGRADPAEGGRDCYIVHFSDGRTFEVYDYIEVRYSR